MKYIALAAGILAASSAHAIEFDVSWTGSDGYSLSGAFGFDDSLLNTGAIDETDIDFLSFEVFDNGASLGSASGVSGDGFAGLGGTSFNFNFDSTSFSLATGGDSAGTEGQDWNFDGPGVGFASGSRAQLVSLDNNGGFASSSVPANASTLEASVSAVPLPGALGLLFAGLGLMSAFRMAGRRA